MSIKYFDKALDFAVKAHKGQKRKFNNNPYILHPMEVCQIAATMDGDDALLSAALLHDTIEDSPVTEDDIRNNFSDRILFLILAETENKRKEMPADASWKIRKQEALEYMAGIDDIDVKKLWLADKLSNVRSLYRMYLDEGDDMWQKFNQTDAAEQKWYYFSVAEATRQLEKYPAWREYTHLLNYIFGGLE